MTYIIFFLIVVSYCKQFQTMTFKPNNLHTKQYPKKILVVKEVFCMYVSASTALILFQICNYFYENPSNKCKKLTTILSIRAAKKMEHYTANKALTWPRGKAKEHKRPLWVHIKNINQIKSAGALKARTMFPSPVTKRI